MALRDRVAGFFAKPKPEARADLNKAARTPDQTMAVHERLTQHEELREKQDADAGADRKAAMMRAGLQHAAPHFMPHGVSAMPPLRHAEIEARTAKIVAADHMRQRQTDAKPEKQLVAEALDRMARQIDRMRDRQAERVKGENKAVASDKAAPQIREAPPEQAKTDAHDQTTGEEVTPEYIALVAMWEAKFAAGPEAVEAFEREEKDRARAAAGLDQPLPQAAYDPLTMAEEVTPEYLATLALHEAKHDAEQAAAPELTLEEREARAEQTRADRAARDAEYSHENDLGRGHTE